MPIVTGTKTYLQTIGYDENWLKDILVAEPGLLGLGPLALIERERQQPQGGIADLLFEHTVNGRRYVVEVMRGSLDESHLVRLIEYWDVEQRLYRDIEHHAVIIAEDISKRFLNVIFLFSNSVPLIAIQCNVLTANLSIDNGQVVAVENDLIVLDFWRVLDVAPFANNRNLPAPAADRAYWMQRTQQTMPVVERMIALINETLEVNYEPNYTQQYIGLSINGVVDNVAVFRPAQQFCMVGFSVEEPELFRAQLQQSGFFVYAGSAYGANLRIQVLNVESIENNIHLFQEIIRTAAGQVQA